MACRAVRPVPVSIFGFRPDACPLALLALVLQPKPASCYAVDDMKPCLGEGVLCSGVDRVVLQRVVLGCHARPRRDLQLAPDTGIYFDLI